MLPLKQNHIQHNADLSPNAKLNVWLENNPINLNFNSRHMLFIMNAIHGDTKYKHTSTHQHKQKTQQQSYFTGILYDETQVEFYLNLRDM